MAAGDLTIAYMRRQKLRAVEKRLATKDAAGLYALGFNGEDIARMLKPEFEPIWEAAWAANEANITALVAVMGAEGRAAAK